MNKKQIDVSEISEFLKNCDISTKIYLGCDSERVIIDNIWYADYTTAVVIHYNGNNGCKIFGAIDRERDYDQRSNKPRMRLMNEVYRVSRLFLELSPLIVHSISVHLDINPSDKFGSNIAINEAIGYIKGTCGVMPTVKPYAWAASNAADRYKDLIHINNT